MHAALRLLLGGEASYVESAVPQLVQNLDRAAFSVPHFGQVTIADAVCN